MNGSPRDHHFIPAFYLRRWAATDEKLYEFSRPYKKLWVKHVKPESTGFQRDLYAFPDLPPDTRHYLESVFFNVTDQLAADALDQLYSGGAKWSADRRTAWSRFIINLHMRHPDPLAEMRSFIKDYWHKTDDHYERHYAEERQEGDPATLKEFIEQLGTEANEKIQLRLLQGLLDHERLGQRLNEMTWAVFDLSNSVFPLLTSDWPAELLLNRGIVSIPIGPYRLFVAANDRGAIRQLETVKHKDLARTTNMFVTSRARRFTFANDRSQERFIDKYIFKAKVTPPFWPSLGTTGRINAAKTGHS